MGRQNGIFTRKVLHDRPLIRYSIIASSSFINIIHPPLIIVPISNIDIFSDGKMRPSDNNIKKGGF